MSRQIARPIALGAEEEDPGRPHPRCATQDPEDRSKGYAGSVTDAGMKPQLDHAVAPVVVLPAAGRSSGPKSKIRPAVTEAVTPSRVVRL